jgi:hypothetical protein
MNIEDFGDLPDKVSLTDEPLSQFSLLGDQLSRGGLPYLWPRLVAPWYVPA